MVELYNIAEMEVKYKTKVKAKDRMKVTCSKSASEILRKLHGDEIEYRENMFILCMNRANQVLAYYKISAGGTAGTVCDKKMIFQIALGCNASGVILCHNHPSGNLKPSTQDLKITKEVKEAGEIMEITLLDHIISTDEGYFSFADEGIL